MLKERAPNVFAAISENLKNLGGRVGFDIDAVTQETSDLAVINLSYELGLKEPISREELTNYWMLAEIVEAMGVPKDEAMKYAKSIWNSHSVYANSPVVPGITTLLHIFNNLNIPYVFISSRPPEFLETTCKWFAKTFPWVKKENIVLGRQDNVSGGDFKALMVQKHEIELHIEDSIEEAKEIVAGTSARVIIVPQPWNIVKAINHPRIKQFDPSLYQHTAGVWPVVKFLASSEARDFLHVAQY